jgi:hypothetical protein
MNKRIIGETLDKCRLVNHSVYNNYRIGIMHKIKKGAMIGHYSGLDLYIQNFYLPKRYSVYQSHPNYLQSRD